MSEDRLRHLVYRCKSCNGLLTKLEIISHWEAMEKDNISNLGVCPCGGRQISPSNVTPEEEKKYETLWQKFRYYVLGKDDEGTRLWKLYDRCVKGKELGELYQQ